MFKENLKTSMHAVNALSRPDPFTFPLESTFAFPSIALGDGVTSGVATRQDIQQTAFSSACSGIKL